MNQLNYLANIAAVNIANIIKQLSLSLVLFLGLFIMMGSQSLASVVPTFSISFSPATIGAGQVSTLTYTVDNTATGIPVSSVAFSNTLPTGMTIASTPNISNTCIDSIATATAGSNSISLSDGRVGSGQTCTFSVDVTSSTVGTHANTTGDLTSSAGNSGSANASLTVESSGMLLNIALNKSSIDPNEIATATITLDASGVALNILASTFNGTLNGLEVAGSPNVSTNCTNAAQSISAGDTSISISNMTFTAGASCTFSFDITSTSVGTHSFSSTGASYTQSNFQTLTTLPASASITVTQPFMYANFPAIATPGSTISLTYNLTNANRVDATAISFSNDLNATLSGLAATSLPATGFCGAGSTASGTSNLTFSGLNLTSGESCSFSVQVLVPANATPGSYTNTTSTINITLDSATTKPAVSNTLQVQNGPQITSTILTSSTITPGDDFTIRYTITNTDAANTLSAISFYEPMSPVMPTITDKTLPAANSCGTGSTFTYVTTATDEKSFKLDNGELAAGANCSFDVVFTANSSTPTDTYTFTSKQISGTISGTQVYGGTTSQQLSVVAAPTMGMSFAANSVVPGQTVNLSFTLSHSGNAPADATNIGFTMDLSSVITGANSKSGTVSNVCGSGSSISGTTTITLANGTLSPDSSCSFNVTVEIPVGTTAGVYSAWSTSVISADVNGTSTTSAAVSGASLTVTGLTFTQSFITNPALPSSTNTVRYVITNDANAPAASAIQFTHNYSQVISGITVASLPASPCGGSISGTTFLSVSGITVNAGDTCTIDVGISIPSGATDGTYISTTSGLSATVSASNISVDAAITQLQIETLTVNLSTTAATPTYVSPIPVNIDFSRDVTGLAAGDLSVTNGTVANLTGSGKSYVANITPTTDGTVTVALPANSVNDAIDNAVQNPASSTLSITYATAPATPVPTLAFGSPSATLTNTGPVTYGVTYTNASEVNLTSAGITLNKTGTANGSVSVTNGNTNTPTISVGSITGDGTLSVTVEANSARNGDQNAAQTGPTTSFTVDNTKPTPTITDTVATNVNVPFTATITFSEDVNNFVVSDITAVNASVNNFTAVSGSVYTALISPSTEGSVTLDIASGVATDAVSNGNNAATQHAVTYDITAPTLAISSTATHHNAAFTATFTFSEDVTGFALADINVTNGVASNFASTSAKIYTATITPTTDGTVTINVAGALADDLAGNANTTATPYSVTYDTVAPTLNITSPSADVNAKFTATFTFSEAVTGFTSADITVTNASVSNFAATSNSVYTADITPSTEGSTTVTVAAIRADDLAGNANSAGNLLTVTNDTTSPTVAITTPDTTINSAFVATFTFSENVTGFDQTDITLTNGNLSNFAATSASVYTATITPTSEGDVNLDVAANLANDAAGNSNTAAPQLKVTYDVTAPTLVISSTKSSVNAKFTATFTFNEDVTGFALADIVVANGIADNFVTTNASTYTADITPTKEGSVTVDVAANLADDAASNGNTAATQLSVIYDTTAPTVAVSSPSNDVNAKFTATFTFSEPVTGFSVTDINVTNANVSNFVTDSTSVYKADITPSTEGAVTVSVAASMADDLAGNANIASNVLNVTHDTTAPTIVISSTSNYYNAPFTATFTFGENVSGFTQSDIVLVNANISNFATVSASSYTATISPQTEGDVTINVAANVATDASGNSNVAATQLKVVYDTTSPSTTISATSTAFNAKFTATFTFSEDVSGFALSDINVTNGSASNFVTLTPSSYTADITPSTEGSVTVLVAASQAVDVATNGNKASNILNVTYDTTAPTINVTAANSFFNKPFVATFTISEAVTDFALTDITVTNGAASNFITKSSTVYEATITPTTEGTVDVSVAAALAHDAAGNANIASNILSISYDTTLPTLAISGPTVPVNQAFTASFTFNEAVTGFDVSDIKATNAGLTNFATTSNSSYSVLVTPTSDGQVTLDVAASSANDSSGNGNTAATQFAVTYDATKPTVTISGSTVPVNTAFTATFDFSETVTDFALNKVAITNGSASNLDSSQAPKYTATITPTTDGDVTISIAAGQVSDVASNTNSASNQYTVSFDTTAPTVQTLNPANNQQEVAVKPDLILNFNENVVAGSSNNQIGIYNLTTNTMVQSYTSNSSNVTINNSQVTIKLDAQLEETVEYFVNIGTNTFTDTAGNLYAGMTDNSSWRFKITNEPPLSQADNVNVDEDNTVVINVLSNDNGGNSTLNPASVRITQAPTKGTASVNSTSGRITYTPFADQNGSDSLKYAVNDMLGASSGDTTVSITINPVNDGPKAHDDVTTTSMNANISIDVLANDTDVDNQSDINSATLTISKMPQNGSAEMIDGKIYYRPNANFSGSDTLQYNVSDKQQLASNTATVFINVTGTNVAPVASNDSISTDEDNAVTISVLNNDSDSDGQLDLTSVQLLTTAGLGQVSVNSDGTLTYTPTANVYGSDSFYYLVRDNQGAYSNKAGVTVTINAVNDAPITTADTVILLDRNTTQTINVVGNDTDSDGTISSINITTQPQFGSASVDSTSLLVSYTASGTFTGSDSFSYTATDNNGATSTTTTVTITEGAVNLPPLANNDYVQTNEDQFISIDVLANDSDQDGRIIPMTLQVTSAPTNGSAVVRVSEGQIYYTPNSNFSGRDQFSYQVSDNSNDSATATVTIDVISVNDAPTANNQTVSTNEETNVSFTVVGNDVDGDTISYHIEQYPANGVVTGTLPNISYQPNTNFSGVDNISFKVNDGQLDSVTAIITINVAAVNDAPVANAQSISLGEDTSLAIFLSGTDADNDTLSYRVATSPTNGALTGSGNSLVYAPNSNFNGSDSFTFVVNDGTVDSAPATVSINVTSANDAPVANDQNQTVTEDTSQLITLTATDIDQDTLTYSIVQTPSHGGISTTDTTGRTFTYTPNQNYHGSDVIGFIANDGSLNSQVAYVNLTVSPQNDAPTAFNRQITTNEDIQVSVQLQGLDIDGDSLTVTNLTQPSNGTLTGQAPSLVYQPNANFNGSDSFSYSLNDGQTDSNTATISITVNSVNDAPVAVNDSHNQQGSNSALIDVLANDSDVDGDTLTISSANATIGSVLIVDNQLNYLPIQNYVGQVIVNYNITDGQGGTASAVLTIELTAASANLISFQLPPDVEINAKGLLTEVTVGQATATDSEGNDIEVVRLDDANHFKPGINQVLWQATDSQGNTALATQLVKVHPLINIDADQIVEEGQNTSVKVQLNGRAPYYPVIVPYSITGSSESGQDHNLTDGEITIEYGTEASINIALHQDQQLEGDETLNINLDNQQNLGQQASHLLTISEQLQLPKLALTVQQGEVLSQQISQNDEQVKVMLDNTSLAQDFQLNWSLPTAIENLSSDVTQLTFDTKTLATGIYPITLTLVHKQNSALSISQSINLKLTSNQIQLNDQDSDGDGITDIEEGFSDSDNDGIANYLDAIDQCNVLASNINQLSKHLIETQTGICLALGKEALEAGNQTPAIQSAKNKANNQQLFDLTLNQLPIAGNSYALVLSPIHQLQDNSQLQIQINDIWHDFVENGQNQITSTKAEQGYCPPPNHPSYQSGLTAGHWCIQIIIQDGGINDADQLTNRSIGLKTQIVTKAVNSIPQAFNDTAELEAGNSIIIDVLANDNDADKDTLTIISATAEHGEVTIDTTTNQLNYSVGADYTGIDTINYQIADSNGGQDTAQVIVTVTAPPVSDSPPLPGSEPQQSNSSGGGGSMGWLLIVVGLLGCYRRQGRL